MEIKERVPHNVVLSNQVFISTIEVLNCLYYLYDFNRYVTFFVWSWYVYRQESLLYIL